MKSNKQDNVYIELFSENGKWGYDIFVNDKCFIHQDIIPGVPGNVYFNSKKDAELVGKLVLKKIINKEIPAVDTGELKQLGIKGTS